MSYEIGDEMHECPNCGKEFPQPVPEEGCPACQAGNQDASATTVSDYIHHEYGLDYEAARELVKKHASILADGVNLRSKAYYVGDRIVRADGG